MLTREQILAVDDCKETKKVNTPEWGKGSFVFVKTISAKERDTFESEAYKIRNGEGKNVNFRAAFAVACISDENGKQLFSPEDADALGDKSGSVIDRIFEAAMILNKMKESDIEDLEKN